MKALAAARVIPRDGLGCRRHFGTAVVAAVVAALGQRGAGRLQFHPRAMGLLQRQQHRNQENQQRANSEQEPHPMNTPGRSTPRSVA